MIHAEIIAAGRLRPGPLLTLWQDYSKRMVWPLILHEIEGKTPADEEKRMLDRLDPRAFRIILDERGKSLSSRQFAEKIGELGDQGAPHVQFIIGSADGLPPSIREQANLILSFGQQTWPHMLARIMLIEQIYRAQQILSGHPYHRD